MVFWHTTQGFKRAIESRKKEMVDYLINTVNIDLEHSTFDKILHYAIARAVLDTLKPEKEALNDAIFKLLLEKKRAFIDEQDDTHENLTPLGLCCFSGVISIAKVLIENGADVNPITETNLTPIGLALL